MIDRDIYKKASDRYIKKAMHHNIEKKWTFVRIPKTASTSITDTLYKLYPDTIASQTHNPDLLIKWNLEGVEDHKVWGVVRDPYTRFESFLKMMQLEPNNFIAHYEEIFAKHNRIRVHALPQTELTHYADGTPLCDKLLRFENIAEEFARLMDRPIPLPVLRKSEPTMLPTYDKSWVREYYARDFELLGYEP
jgi:hypothetical protein